MCHRHRSSGNVSTVLVAAAFIVVALACVPHVLAQTPRASAPPSGASPSEPGRSSSKLDKAAASSAQAMAKYRASLEPVEAMYERELARQTELAEIRQELYERGTLSASDVQQGRRALVKAQKDVDDIRRQRVEVDRMMVEMRMIEVGKQRPLARGGYEETPGLVRFNGPAPWSLAEDVPKLQRFFQTRARPPVPTSTWGSRRRAWWGGAEARAELARGDLPDSRWPTIPEDVPVEQFYDSIDRDSKPGRNFPS
ncbi:MAG: hypothetical protein DME16_26580 [Candidatus Rokuibacteriota bacterium]|nr:MAG: hypothetical protein DME16_26580 [Candidatus Rokubacteria bacterium]